MPKYLLVFSLHDSKPARLADMVPRLQKKLTEISKSPPEQAFRSLSADTFGYCITSELAPRQIQALIETPARSPAEFVPPILAGEDHMMILELGSEHITERGFTRLGGWLLRH